jgi:putative hydrolase of the HAD superfamily
MIRGIIFDLGNTLMYFDGDWETTIARGADNLAAYLNERGYPVAPEFAAEFRAVREAGRKRATLSNVEYTAEQALLDTLAKFGVCYVPDAVIPRAVEKFFEPEEPRWVTYADARDTLAELRARGYKLAAMSNATDHAFIERIARNGGIAEFFDPLVSSAKISHRKPDPRAFQLILDAWQIPVHEIVMVGDAPSFDILGAHRAGMRGVLMQDRWETEPQPHDKFEDAALMQPDAAIRQLAELPSLVAAWNEKEPMHG